MAHRFHNIVIAFLLAFTCGLTARADVIYDETMLPMIIADLYQELLENEVDVDFEQLEEDLLSLHDHPINLNSTSAEELSRLPFLSDEQIDAILMLAYRRPFISTYELMLVEQLEDYEIRNMLPFVTVAPPDEQTEISVGDLLSKARHQMLIRTDARNIENNGNDPFYAAIRYKMQCRDKLELGLTIERDPHEPFYYKAKTYGADFYGGYMQLANIGKLLKLVIGDYRVGFGEGLTMSNNFAYNSKLAYTQNRGFRREGISRKSSTAEYNFMRGIAATARLGIADLSLFYSARKVDGNSEAGKFPAISQTGYHRTERELEDKRTVWQQIVGANLTLRLKRLRVGITFAENLLGDTLSPRNNYYNVNHFRGNRQANIGLNYSYQHHLVSLFGEVTTSQNRHWGIAALTGISLHPASNIQVVAVHRYYSPYQDNMLAGSLGSSSRLTDEHGILLGTDLKPVLGLQLTAYADIYRYYHPHYSLRTPAHGYDLLLKAQYQHSERQLFGLRLRSKFRGGEYTHSLRFQANISVGAFRSQTTVEGNLAHGTDTLTSYIVDAAAMSNPKMTFGALLAQQIEYSFSIPITLQVRAEAFFAPNWNNRFYLYENDVLYAMNIPALYGIGTRCFLNLRYSVNEHLSLYLKVSETVLQRRWHSEHSGTTLPHQTDLHLMARVKW